MKMKRTDLGDGVFADFDGFGVVLSTVVGCGASSQPKILYLPPQTIINLMDYLMKLGDEIKSSHREKE